MAVARVLCGACDGEVSSSDVVCPHCGAKVELPGSSAEDVQVSCEVCGERNRPGAKICNSCGAKLSGPISRSVQGRSGPKKKARPSSHASRDGRPGRKLEPWQIVSAVAVLMLVAYFVYSEVSRDLPVAEGRPAQSAPPQNQAPPVDIGPLERAVEENPGDAKALLALANVLQDVRDFPRAIEFYRRYLELNPSNPDARVDMGICYFELARVDTIHGATFYAAAVQEMETVYEQHPHHQHAAFNLGIVHLNFGDLDASNMWLRRAVEVDASSDLGVRAEHLLQQHAITE